MDFTLKAYAHLCGRLQALAYVGWGIGRYVETLRAGGALPPRLVLLRHDVDSRPRHALRLGAIEAAHGFCATYFFRTVPSAFSAKAVRGIHAQGHEVGYHYETLAQTNGDLPAALRLFGEELARLRALAPVRVASMHGSPLRKWDNRALWDSAEPATFGLLGEAYRDIDYQRVAYFSDTGRTWHPSRYNVRDHTSALPRYAPDSTADLLALIEAEQFPELCLLTHPERWQALPWRWAYQTGRDLVSNGVKWALMRVRP